MSDWISVKDRLPVHGNYTLTFHENSVPPIRIHCYSNVAKQWSCNSGGKITHWMPLPDPPQHRETCDCEFPDIDIAWGCEHEYCKRCGNDMHER